MWKLLARTITVVLAAAFMPLAGLADATGVSGIVIDRSTGKPVAGAAISVYELPPMTSDRPDMVRVRSLKTDRRGFFSDLGLEPGGYLITATVPRKAAACAVHAVYNGVVRHLQIVVSNDSQAWYCRGPYTRPVDPDETADVYRIH
ncbi:MAG: carboxypeptidase-like regulatory domain-containing protein [Vulcanimicrobiaceae bacterium]